MQILYPLINDINLKNNDGHSALSKSVIYAKKDAFNFLTKNGANLNIEDKKFAVEDTVEDKKLDMWED